MKRLALLLCLSLPACSMITVKTVNPTTNVTCEATYSRFWFDQEGLRVEVCGGKASVAKSDNNAEALSSLLPLIARGVAGGIP